jgi:hypothetical protein
MSQRAERFVCVQFCDDVRQEVGNKISLMGCYQNLIQVQQAPAVLPKLCLMAKVYTPLDRPFRRLIIRILRNETQKLAELAYSEEALATPIAPVPEGSQGQLFSAILIISPFTIDDACTLRVEAETDEEPVRSGLTWVKVEPVQPTSAS